MKKNTKALLPALILCMATLSFTACGNAKDLFDMVTGGDFEDAIDNLENLDQEDLENLVDNLEESDFEGLIGDLAGESDDDTSVSDDNFDLGNVDGNIYSNSFIDVQCEFESPWHYYSGKELAAINNITFSNLEDAVETAAKAALENGSVYIIMFAQNQDNLDSVNITLQYFGFDITEYYTVDEMIDNSLPSLETTLTAQGVKDTEAIKSTTTFLGETVPCIEITGSINDTPLYEKQVIIIFDEYVATITAASLSGEDTTSEILDAFSAY